MTRGTALDVLVVGGGMAGVCALVSAAEAGGQALLLEKREALGGSTVMSAGLLAFAGTREQHALGIEDDVELLKRDLLETGRHKNVPELVDAYCEHQLATYDWLADQGVSFGHPDAGSGQSVPRSHPVDTTAAIELLSRRGLELGAQITYEARAERLLLEDGRVVGARVRVGDQPREFRAATVVLATGGFTRSPGLLEQFAPGMDKALRGGGAGSTGDGLLMGCKVGAALVDMAYVKGTFGIFPWPSVHEEGTGILAIYKGAIAVNGLGKRFVDESIPYKEIGDACLAQPEALAYQIFDARVLAAGEREIAIYDFTRRVEVGHAQVSESLEGLADKLGLPPENLAVTVAEYNRRIAEGHADEFGRETLSGGVGRPFALETPPYYGFPTTTVVLATYCGLAVDANGRVIDVFGDAIPGLYGAGELIGGFHGAGYVTGTSIGKAAILGRIAGQRAALEARTPVAR